MNTMRRVVAVPLTLFALVALSSCGSDPADDAEQPPSAQTTDTGSSDSTSGDTLALTADGSSTAKCAVPSADMLSGFDTAFAGTVTSVSGGTATLSVDQWFTGGDASTVTVAAPSKDMQDLLMAVDFQEGRSYLVSATDGRVTLCGFTAEESPELQSLYDQAFAG